MTKLLSLSVFFFVVSSPAQETAQETKPEPRPTLPQLLKQLDHKNPEVRAQAMMELGELGPKAAPAVKRLVAALAEKNDDVRLNAALALGKIGKAAVAPLVPLLKSSDEEVRFYAVWALGSVGPEAAAAAKDIIRVLADKSDAVRRKAAYALGRIGGDNETVIDELAATLHDRDEDVRAAAAEALVKHGVKAVPALVIVLGSCKPGTARLVVQSLGEIGSDAKGAVPDLRQLLLVKGQPPDQAAWVAAGLGKIGKHALDALADGVKDDRPFVRQASLEALAQMQGEGVSQLIDGLGDKRVDVRRTAARLLGPMNINDKVVVLGLAFALKDEDDLVRVRASESLENLTAGARIALPHLVRALPDSHAHVRSHLLNVLQALGVDQYAELRKHFKSENAATRVYAACSMIVARVDRQEALSVVRQALMGKDPVVRVRAAHALAFIAEDVPTILPVLTEALKDDRQSTREHALEALQALGKSAEAAAPAVLDVLRIPDYDLRRQALNTLRTVRGKPEDVVPVLAKYLREPSNFRIDILDMLWEYGPPAVPPLLEAMGDKDDTHRLYAKTAVHRMRAYRSPLDLEALLPVLVAQAKNNPSEEGRQLAVELMDYAGTAAVAPLLDVVKGKDESLRQLALGALVRLGPKAARAVPTLVSAALNDTPRCQRLAVYALAAQGNDGIKSLRQALAKKRNDDVYAWLVEATYSFRGSTEAVDFLTEVLRQAKPELRAQAATALGHYQAAEAIPHLKRALKDKNNNVAYQSAWALGRIGPAGQAELLESAKREAATRPTALYGLANHNYKDAKAVPFFIEWLKDEREDVRHRAAYLIGMVGPEAREAAPALVAALGDKEGNVRAHAHNALKALGDAAHPALLDGLKHDDSALRGEILLRLAQQMPPVEKSVPALVNVLKDKSAAIRAQAARLLGDLGPAAREAVPALERLRDDTDAAVRQTAQKALTHIQSKPPKGP